MSKLCVQLGFEELKPMQKQVVLSILRRRDLAEAVAHSLVHLPTGYGKSLIFTLLCLLLDKPILIIYPLKALISDQMERFTKLGISAYMLSGESTNFEFHEASEKLLRGEIKVLATNPELICSKRAIAYLPDHVFSLACVDEAHTISQWGESFRPTMQFLGLRFSELGIGNILALSASFTEHMVENIKSTLFLHENFEFFDTPIDRPNIFYKIVESAHPISSLKKMLEQTQIELSALVFCSTRIFTEYSARMIFQTSKCEIKFFHAGLEREEKDSIAHWLKSGNERILFATCAFGMGIDCNNIRSIIHLGEPDSLESFIQESGRGGRDGKPARSITIIPFLSEGKNLIQLYRNNECIRRGMREYLYNQDAYLKSDYCCSVCEGQAESDPPMKDFTDLVKKNSGQFKEAEFISELRKKYAHFRSRELKHFLERCLEKGIIKKSRNPLYWGRLC